jgi:glycosyltransferase involved in cell wall biosynthesis
MCAPDAAADQGGLNVSQENLLPKVSVIIPAFNHAAFLPAVVDSVLAQTFQDFEIIIVDDGSSDDTRAVCARFPAGRVRYIYQENKGSSGARNTGIRLASGDYIAFLDADDWFLPEKLSLQTRVLDEHPDVGLVAGGWMTVNAAGEVVQLDCPWLAYPTLDARLLLREDPLVVHSILVRRTWLEQVGLFNEALKFVEDWDVWLRLALAGCKMVWSEQLVCKRRMHAHNKSRDARQTRDGVLAVLNNVLPVLPADLAAERESILAYWYLVGAAGEYAASGLEEYARRDLGEAVRHDPSLVAGKTPPACQVLVSYAGNVHVEDGAAFIERVVDNLPPEALALRGCRRKMLASVYINNAFAFHSIRQTARRRSALWTGLSLDPRGMFRRGVPRLFFESIFGRDLTEAARRVYHRLTGRP